jgi:hypothetical protein
MTLAQNDQLPAGTDAVRRLSFTLECGENVILTPSGYNWPQPYSPAPWRIEGYDVDLPSGYRYTGDTYELFWSPSRKRGGFMELDVVSPCHDAVLDGSLGDGVLIGNCNSCGEEVSRMNPRTGVSEWLDGNSPWSQRALRPIGFMPATTAKISYHPTPGAPWFYAEVNVPHDWNKNLLVGNPWFLRVGRSEGSPATASFTVDGKFADLTAKQKAIVKETVGDELLNILVQAEAAGLAFDERCISLLDPPPSYAVA